MQGFGLIIRDLRHMSARAASDLADWLVHLELEGKADRTLYAYHRYLATLLREHPDLELREITHSHINDVLRQAPPRSRYIPRSVFAQFFAWATLEGRVDHNPMIRVPRMRQPRRRPTDIFSEAEQALLEALPTPDGELFAILFGTGLRRGEARRLRRDHIDLARARLVVYHGKGDKDRIVLMPPDVLAAVARLDLLEGLGPRDHLWYSLRGKRRMRRDPIADTTFAGDERRWYDRCIAAAGVRYLNPHQTRHTYGHRLRERGFDIEERQLLMGHESINTTQRYYGHLTIEDLTEKVARL